VTTILIKHVETRFLVWGKNHCHLVIQPTSDGITLGLHYQPLVIIVYDYRARIIVGWVIQPASDGITVGLY